MRAANRFRVTHLKDHIVLRFGFSESEDSEEFGEQVEEMLLPITTTALLAMRLFESMTRSTVDITRFFTELQAPMAKLNALSTELEKEKAVIQASGAPRPKKEA